MNPNVKLSWIPSLLVLVGMLAIVSCGDDEKPKSGFSFAETEAEVNESDGTVQVVINFDRAVSETVRIAYTLEGTATEFSATTGGDYEISPEGGIITVAPGATEAVFDIEIFEDGAFEVDFDEGIGHETVIITLTEVVSGPAQLGTEGLQYTLSIFEDDTIVFLDWDAGGGTTGDVDMDILFWGNDPDDNPDEGYQLINPSAVGGGNSEGTDSEAILLVAGNWIDADYGMSYVYYSGTSDDVDFTVDIVNFGGTLNGTATELSFVGNYGLVNINKYDETGAEAPIVVQTMTKSGVNYTDISEIAIPPTGSRLRTITGGFGSIDRSQIRRESTDTNVPGVQRIKLPASFIQKLRNR